MVSPPTAGVNSFVQGGANAGQERTRDTGSCSNYTGLALGPRRVDGLLTHTPGDRGYYYRFVPVRSPRYVWPGFRGTGTSIGTNLGPRTRKINNAASSFRDLPFFASSSSCSRTIDPSRASFRKTIIHKSSSFHTLRSNFLIL